MCIVQVKGSKKDWDEIMKGNGKQIVYSCLTLWLERYMCFPRVANIYQWA